MSYILKATDVHKSYGKNKVLKGLNLSVQKGQIHSILGANGAGKTTFIKIISTLLLKDSGSIDIAGYSIDKDRYAIKKVIGYVGQDTERSAYARLSARDNLLYFGKMQGLKRKEILKQIDIFCDLFSIDKLLHKPFMTLSGGQKQIIVITRALLHDPQLVILDEPTKGLDPIIANSMREFLKRYSSEMNKTILLTSHILSEVEYLSDTVSLINDGKLIIEGSPNELMDSLDADVYFEVDKNNTDRAIIGKLNEIFTTGVSDNEKYILYPLNNLCDDSIIIFNILKEYDNKAQFRYKYTSLEDVFLQNISGYNERFE
jgi:ABC-2 type transport system ATP-binding protein